MAQLFRFTDISKLWHSKPKHSERKHTALKSVNQIRQGEQWDMSPEDALRVTYSGHK